MNSNHLRPGSAVAIAALCSAALTAQLVGGKAARDALFLAQLGVTSLPTMVIVSSLVSIALVILSSKAMTRLTPSTFVPAAFLVSAILFIAEWTATSAFPKAASVLVY